ncbi:MAG: hypothetical protein V4654_00485 [Bdellovibrionota bacterium]
MLTKKLSLRSMRTLKSDSDLGVKAASGLVKVGNTFYVIADDEVSLAEFNFEGHTTARYIRLLGATLPVDPVARKKQKPDWESLIQLKLADDKNILLAVPSGSTENRMTGAFVYTNNSAPFTVDFSALYSALKVKLPELNIEGACILNDKLKLFQRGNGAAGKNAVIDLDLKGFCSDLSRGVPIAEKNLLAIHDYDLGHFNGYKLDFTDACAVNDSIWFLAVSEQSQSTYDDGKYCGAVIGCLDSSGKEIARYEIDCATKPEGLWVELEQQRICFYVVTDADSTTIYSSIYFGKLLL